MPFPMHGTLSRAPLGSMSKNIDTIEWWNILNHIRTLLETKNKKQFPTHM